jgi:KUP system potassium uptake protein
LGVVYGDIGSSPIYACREALHAASTDGSLLRADVLGIVSMIFWALTLIVTVKYILFVLRADNDGEGGIPEQVAEAVRVNTEARLRALKIGLQIMAGLAFLAIFPAGGMPDYRPGEIPANPKATGPSVKELS